ncbi:MAG: hypothetical protein EBR58_05565 [Betaproteobacteria bacterium]|nr:hypothetical protein [Betaproteobacteria bacterium]
MNTSTTSHLLTHFRDIARRIVLALGLVASAFTGVSAAWAAGGDTWQEEVLLHDGQTMLVERNQTYGGRSEIGQSAPVADQTMRFTVPKGQQTIVWHDPFESESGPSGLRLLAVHVKDGRPYVVAEPLQCQSYNKWGRPNPPYLFFKWTANNWQRIDIEALPVEFNTLNITHRTARRWAREHNGTTLTATEIQAENATNQPQYRSILREPMPSEQILSMCDELVNYKGYWIDPRNPFARKYIDEKSK